MPAQSLAAPILLPESDTVSFAVAAEKAGDALRLRAAFAGGARHGAGPAAAPPHPRRTAQAPPGRDGHRAAHRSRRMRSARPAGGPPAAGGPGAPRGAAPARRSAARRVFRGPVPAPH